MKLSLAFTLSVVLCPLPAWALDCAKASLPVEKLICATPNLKKADEAMSAAYFKLLRETTDADFREALIRSQRRWIVERSRGVDRFGAAEGDKTDDREVLLEMTRGRLGFLREAGPVRAMEKQREIMAKDGGGSFAGYESYSCFFSPPPYGSWNYICPSAVHRQHNDRICSVATMWASGHTIEYRLVSILKDGEPKAVASCSTGDAITDEECPEPDGDVAAHWNTNPVASDYLPKPRAGNFWKYDADVESNDIDQPWMHDCLFAATYPPPDASRANPPPVK